MEVDTQVRFHDTCVHQLRADTDVEAADHNDNAVMESYYSSL